MDMNASARWTDDNRFLCSASTGHTVVADAGDKKTASSPMELVLMGLCSCTAVDVVTILRKKREPFTSVEVLAESERAPEPPKIFTKIKLVYRIGGQVNRKSIEDAIRLSTEKYCSVEAMLKKTAQITYAIELV